MSTPLADQLREYFDALQKQVTHLKDAADQAREETSAQVRARIEQAKADVAADQEPAREKAGQAVGRGQSQWQSMKADAAARMRDLHGRIGITVADMLLDLLPKTSLRSKRSRP